MTVWIDGHRRRTLDVFDRGLQYGDGVFETMYAADGAVRLLELHLARLQAGLERLAIVAPARTLRAEVRAAARGSGRATLKLIVTRGTGERGYRPRGDERARRVLMRLPPPAVPDSPVRVRICRTRLATGAPAAGFKTLGRLESVLARSEWRSPRVFEGLMCDAEGRVVCGTMTNLFLRRGKTLYTPDVRRCGVAGVMRRWILREAPEMAVRVREVDVTWKDLAVADEVFLSNALLGPVSVRAVEWQAVRDTLAFAQFGLADGLRERLALL